MKLSKLTKNDCSALQWSRSCNDENGLGFLGPTVKQFGPLPEFIHLVVDGLLRCEEDLLAQRRNANKCGYWITPAGRLALNESGDASTKSGERT